MSELCSLTVEELVTRMLNASPEEESIYCREIIRRFEPLLRSAWKKAAFTSDYKDYAQDVWVALVEVLPNLKSSSAFPGYLRKVAVGVAAQAVRKHLRDPMADLRDIEADLRDIENAIIPFDGELIRAIHIRYCLEMLTKREKNVMALSMEGLSIKEIAAELKISQIAVRVAMFRARRELRG